MRNIILGVTGSIAAYKAADIASGLTKAGHSVTAVMTRDAQDFVTPLVLQTPSKNPVVTGFMFLVTGGLLLWSAKHESGKMTCRELTFRQAFSIGLFQAFAILPGISRSGATIVAGLGHGLRRDEAAAFSFLLAIPAIGGAGFIEALDLFEKGFSGTPPAALAFGCLVSFLVGLASLAWLVRWLQQGRLHIFAWWVFPLGIAVLAWQLLG